MTRQLLSQPTETTTTKKPTDKKAVEGQPSVGKKQPATFDLAMWAQGVKPIKRSIPLYQRLDLLAERDQVGEALDNAKATGNEELLAELRADAERITDEIEGSKIVVTLQGIAPSRFTEVLEEAKNNDDLTTGADIQLWVLNNQIVEPAGFTFEILQELNDLIPTQIERLCKGVNQVNSAVPNVKATVPF